MCSSLILISGCANKKVQEYFTEPDYTTRAATARTEERLGHDVPAPPEDIIDQAWEYAMYMGSISLMGPGGIQQMMDGYGAKGWEIIMILNPSSGGTISDWFFFFFKKPMVPGEKEP